MLFYRKFNRGLLVYGDFEVYDLENVDTFIFSKKFEGKYILGVMNFTSEEKTFYNPFHERGILKLMFGTLTEEIPPLLMPYEGRLYYVHRIK